MQQTDIKKLLKTANRKTDRTLKYDDDVVNFIDFYNIKSGRTWVKFNVLRKLYYLWSREPYDITKLRFSLNRYLKSHPVKGYSINQNSIKLTKVALNSIKTRSIPVIRQKQIHLFLSENKIESGTVHTTSAILYKVYVRWCRAKRKPILNREKFIGLTKLFVTYKTTQSHKLVFSINKDPKDILIITSTRKVLIKTIPNETV